MSFSQYQSFVILWKISFPFSQTYTAGESPGFIAFLLSTLQYLNPLCWCCGLNCLCHLRLLCVYSVSALQLFLLYTLNLMEPQFASTKPIILYLHFSPCESQSCLPLMKWSIRMICYSIVATQYKAQHRSADRKSEHKGIQLYWLGRKHKTPKIWIND